MTQLPLWAVYVVAFGTPASALLGALLSMWLTRMTAREVDVRAGRDELMRNLRWAAELAADHDEARQEVGVQELRALGGSHLLDSRDQIFIDAALTAVSLEADRSVARALSSEVDPADVQVDELSPDDRSGPGVSSTHSDESRSA